MREAEITCLVPKVTLVDLSLRLTKGEVIWIPAIKAEKSEDLWKVRDMGSVSVRWVQRYRVMKHSTEYAPVQRAARPKEVSPPPVETPAQSDIDIDELSRRIREDAFMEVTRHMGDLKASLIKDIQEVLQASSAELKQQPSPIEGLSDLVGEAVRNAVGSLPIASATSTGMHGTVDDGAPLFIPSTILGDSEMEAEINVKSSESSDDGIDDAMAALRALKKAKMETDNE